MREIKFRAWDAAKKEMFPDEVNSDLLVKFFRDVNEKGCFATVMQYTGLKDKNGVEIYEGDIVFHSMTRGYEKLAIGVIEWDDYRAQWRHSRYSEECLSGWKLEVIGNRYENPELLEQNNASPTN